EMGAEFEVAARGGTALAGVNPLAMVPRGTRQALGRRRGALAEAFWKKQRSTARTLGEDHALFSDEEGSPPRQRVFAEGLGLARFQTAVVPVEPDLGAAIGRGEVVVGHRPDGHDLVEDLTGRMRRDPLGQGQVEGPDRGVEIVAGEVAERSA